MYAIVEIAGQQFKVQKDQKIFVHRLKDEEGAEISFDTVMLKEDDGNVVVGTPTISGASVSAKVIKHIARTPAIVVSDEPVTDTMVAAIACAMTSFESSYSSCCSL